jgi:hypothetical protein
MFIFVDYVSSFADTAINLQRQINEICYYCAETPGMSIYHDKSKIIVFRNGSPLRQYEHWMYNAKEIEVVNCYKYLETILDLTKDVLAIQATKAVYVIYAYQKHFGYFSVNDAFKLLDAMVKPILTHSSEILGYNTCQWIENVHISFCQRIACLNQNIASFFTLSECGRLPISLTYMSKYVKYSLKLTEMPQYWLPRQSLFCLET